MRHGGFSGRYCREHPPLARGGYVLNILARSVGAYQVNTILVWCEQTRQAAIIDPAGESEQTFREIERRKLKPVVLLNTHGHLDHITDNALVKERFDVPLLIHELDRPMLADPAKNLSLFTGDAITSPDADGTLAEGDTVKIGVETLQVLHVPGHTPGSLVFYHPGFAITGDTLFAGGVARTDFPGCDEQQLFENIRRKLYSLSPETVVYPGHGSTTTIGEERRTNPFIRG
jgi:hydroxyacylglutathione hydrolase